MQTFSSGTKRRQFLNEFTEALTIRLHKSGLNCWLSCTYNSFTTANNKKGKKYWRGLFKCKFPNCGIEYEATIEDEPDFIIRPHIILKIQSLEVCLHEKLCIQPRISGKSRSDLGKELMLKGVTNVRIENILANRDINDINSENSK